MMLPRPQLFSFNSELSISDEDLGAISSNKVPQFACYLLFNGILGEARLKHANVRFKHIPHDVRVR